MLIYKDTNKYEYIYHEFKDSKKSNTMCLSVCLCFVVAVGVVVRAGITVVVERRGTFSRPAILTYMVSPVLAI